LTDSGYQEFIQKGDEFTQSGKWSNAVREYRRAIDLAPHEPEAYVRLAIAFHRSGEWEKALEELEHAVTIIFNEPSLLSKLAETYDYLGQEDKAIKTYLSLAFVYFRRRELEPAVEALEQVVRIAPERLELRERLAEGYMKADRPQDAARAFLQLSRLQAGAGNTPAATKAAEQAASLEPENAEISVWLQQLKKGRIPSAAWIPKEAPPAPAPAPVEPSEPAPETMEAQKPSVAPQEAVISPQQPSEEQEEEQIEAGPLTTAQQGGIPSSFQQFEILGETLLFSDRPSEARDYFMEAAELCLKDGLLDGAIDQGLHLLNLWPDYLPAHTLLAKAYVVKGFLPLAVEKFMLLAKLYSIRGEKEIAIGILKGGLELLPEDPDLADYLNQLTKAGA